jgi:cell division protein FtsI (penicillin-binding protein 3)
VKNRALLVFALMIAWMGAIVGRLVYLQLFRHEHYVDLAERQQQRVQELAPPRGTIFDARGNHLAVSGPADSIFAVPREVQDRWGAARALAPLLEMPAAELVERFAKERAFVWLKRQIDHDAAERVKALQIKGIGVREESRRFYPQGELGAHVVGFVGTDFQGLAGLEDQFDERLTGKTGRRVVLRDAGGRYAVNTDLAWTDAEPGEDLYLTLDSQLQYLAERELKRSVEEFGAEGGSVVLLDPATGAVLAMASYPTFNPNHFNEYGKESRKNRVITDVFEPGSTFKMVPVAAAIEANLVDAADVFDCGMGKFVFGGITIRDHKPFGLLSLRDVMAKSSNVGAIKVGLAAGEERLWNQIVALGFGRRSGIELPGESPGILHPRQRWQPITKAYVSFGQGVAVTALQLAAAFTPVANGGNLVRPHLVAAAGKPGQVRSLAPESFLVGRAMSPATAKQVERLLEAVLLEGGTAATSAIPGFNLAGKTGTAQMADGKGYSATDHMAVFAGIAPGRNPRLVGAVVVDRPRKDYHGGSVAAPIFSRIAKEALLYFGIRPERELDTSKPWPGQNKGREAEPRTSEPTLLAQRGRTARAGREAGR